MVGPNKHTQTGAQCSDTSVGLAQARPNYSNWIECSSILAVLIYLAINCLQTMYVNLKTKVFASGQSWTEDYSVRLHIAK